MPEQPDTANRPDVPDAAETVLTSRNKPVSDPERNERAYRQAVERKIRIQQLEAELAEWKGKFESVVKERDEAVKTAEETQKAYQEFTSKDAQQQTIAQLQSEIKRRDLADVFNSIEGVEYQDGVTLDDVLQAAGMSFDEIEDITEDLPGKVIEAARAKKPFLFSPGSASEQPGEVRQETATQAPAQQFKAFGAQAAGGGATAEMKKPDLSDPIAALRYVSERMGQSQK